MQLSERIAALDRAHRHVQKQARDRGDAPNPWVDNKGKHGIEKLPNGTYLVHVTTPAGAYRFVGDYADIVSAEAAFALASSLAKDAPVPDDGGFDDEAAVDDVRSRKCHKC